MMNTMVFPPKIGISSRDVACFVFAAAVHSLLFLWKGGLLTLPDQPGDGLGDMLVQVNFMAEVPNYDLPGGGTPKPQGFLAKVTSLLKGQGSEKIQKSAGADDLQSNWMKSDKLVDKSFSARDGFQGMKDKVDNLDIAKGQSQEVVMKPSQGNFEKAQPNLKENAFKVAKADVPFPILKPKTSDALANVNAIPVVVGKTTSGSIKSLDGGPGSGPALQSKTFASKGSSGGGFSGIGNTSGGTGSSDGMGIAMGGSGGGNALGSGIDNGGLSGSGGSGFGSGGSGGGKGGGFGSNTGTGKGGGRAWGGGGSGGYGQMQTLPRNSVPTDNGIASGVNAASSRQAGFTITGALANRPIEQKILPPYETDARVALRFRVDWSGKVLDGIVVEISSGNPTFDQKVMASLKQWIFSRLSGNKINEVQEGLVSFVFKGV